MTVATTLRPVTRVVAACVAWGWKSSVTVVISRPSIFSRLTFHTGPGIAGATEANGPVSWAEGLDEVTPSSGGGTARWYPPALLIRTYAPGGGRFNGLMLSVTPTAAGCD